MRFGESAENNLWFDIGSPWLSVSWKEGLSVPPGAPPAALMNLLRPWEWLMRLFMEIEKQVAAKFTSSNCFLGKQNSLAGWGSCAIWLPFCRFESKS